jgi:transposase
MIKKLDNLEKLNVVHDAVVNLKSNEEIAAKYNVKKSSVSQLIHKQKKDNSYLQEMFKKEKLNNKIEDLIEEVTLSYLETGQHIWRVSII